MTEDSKDQIKDGRMVTIAYVLRNDENEVVDEVNKDDPLEYLHGGSQLIPGLESALTGLRVGDQKKVTVAPEHAYGQPDENLSFEVSKEAFPEEVEIKPGMTFENPALNEEELMLFTVVEIKEDSVVLDGNHPLAGETLHFTVDVLAVRDPDPEDLMLLEPNDGSETVH